MLSKSQIFPVLGHFALVSWFNPLIPKYVSYYKIWWGQEEAFLFAYPPHFSCIFLLKHFCKLKKKKKIFTFAKYLPNLLNNVRGILKNGCLASIYKMFSKDFESEKSQKNKKSLFGKLEYSNLIQSLVSG
jgi:hypothetical protein